MNTKKETAQLIRRLKRDGYTIKYGGKHIKVLEPSGVFLFGLSKNPSGHSAWKKIRCTARKAGCI